MTDRDNRMDVVRIAVVLGDDDLFEKYRTNNPEETKFNTAIGYAMAGRLAEAEKIARAIDMPNSWLIYGLISGGRFEDLKKQTLEPYIGSIRMAALYRHEDVILYLVNKYISNPRYYKLDNIDKFLETLIRNNRPQFTLQVLELLKPLSIRYFNSSIIEYASGAGYTEIVEEYVNEVLNDAPTFHKYVDLLTLGHAIGNAIKYNHIETTIYLRSIKASLAGKGWDKARFNPQILRIFLEKEIIDKSLLEWILKNNDVMTAHDREMIQTLL